MRDSFIKNKARKHAKLRIVLDMGVVQDISQKCRLAMASIDWEISTRERG
jgi:hypothetical protein